MLHFWLLNPQQNKTSQLLAAKENKSERYKMRHFWLLNPQHTTTSHWEGSNLT